MLEHVQGRRFRRVESPKDQEQVANGSQESGVPTPSGKSTLAEELEEASARERSPEKEIKSDESRVCCLCIYGPIR